MSATVANDESFFWLGVSECASCRSHTSQCRAFINLINGIAYRNMFCSTTCKTNFNISLASELNRKDKEEEAGKKSNNMCKAIYITLALSREIEKQISAIKKNNHSCSNLSELYTIQENSLMNQLKALSVIFNRQINIMNRFINLSGQDAAATRLFNSFERLH